MAWRCDVCGKESLSAHRISHSNIKTKRKQKPNLQKIKAEVNGKIKIIKVCTRCLRSGKVKKVA